MSLLRSSLLKQRHSWSKLGSTLTNKKLLSTANTLPGLFSVPGLHAPCDFLNLAKKSMNQCDDIRQSLKSRLKPEFLSLNNQESSKDILESKRKNAIEVLHRLDSLSNHVCTVIDAAELCRCVHSSPQWRESASRAFHLLSEYISDLNADDGLYESLCAHITSDAATFEQLTEEQKRMAILLKSEFERDGIHLPKNERDELRSILQHITNLESTFSNNITTRKKYFKLEKGEVLRIIPKHILDAVVPPNLAADPESNKVTVSSDSHITNTLLKYSPSQSLRKEAYIESHTSCPENLDVLAALIDQRHHLALKLGCKSYAEKFLKDKMAGNPENVRYFLNKMNHKIKGGAKHEMEMISRAKQMIEGDSTLNSWDISFYSGLLKSQKHELDLSELSPYLSVENCIEGMKLLVKSLFGLRIEEEPMTENENWVDYDDTGWNGSKNGVHKLVLYEGKTDEMIGTLYLDLYPRNDKYVHAAHFTVRCGCAVNTDPKPEFQLPVVALVCNLSAPSGNNISLLSHSETETLFHEFGHALHSLLSKTTYQHMSGTRAAVDFVETPSHLMEYYCWDPTFLSAMGKHYSTGEPIPEPLLKKLMESKNSFQSLEIQTQILYALFDQELFGVPSPTKESTTDIFARLHKENNVPYAEGTYWHTRFGHLVTYGAGYYGYLYDQVFAADIWETCLGDDPLKQEKGEILRKEMLMHGGARDPNVMLRSVLGRDPSIDAFIRGTGQ